MPSLQQALLQNLGLCGGWDRQDSNSYSHQGYIPEGKINKQEIRAPDKFRPEMLQGNKADGKMKWDVGGERTTSLSGSRRHSLTKVRLRAANPTDARVSTSFSVSLVVPFYRHERHQIICHIKVVNCSIFKNSKSLTRLSTHHIGGGLISLLCTGVVIWSIICSLEVMRVIKIGNFY